MKTGVGDEFLKYSYRIFGIILVKTIDRTFINV